MFNSIIITSYCCFTLYHIHTNSTKNYQYFLCIACILLTRHNSQQLATSKFKNLLKTSQ
nr:MAG TPA: hypothetical protein [Bacteriophage sp.]